MAPASVKANKKASEHELDEYVPQIALSRQEELETDCRNGRRARCGLSLPREDAKLPNAGFAHGERQASQTHQGPHCLRRTPRLRERLGGV